MDVDVCVCVRARACMQGQDTFILNVLLRALQVYTVNQESRYLLVQNVHALGVTRDLLELFSLYGDIKE